MEISVAFYSEWFWNGRVWGCRKQKGKVALRFWYSFLAVLSGHSCSVSFSWGQIWFSSSYIILSILHFSQRNSDKTDAAGQGIFEFCLLRIWGFVGRRFFIFRRISFKQHASVSMWNKHICTNPTCLCQSFTHWWPLYLMCLLTCKAWHDSRKKNTASN